ncbi:MAG: hypothetical protein NT006_03710 [Candidatus Aminicenantes bacterium]|nr:hypothetical protein [Candidatus Aminicenantes bacterium]
MSDFQMGEWEDSLAKAGKFVEAVLKALFVHVGESPPTGRGFKADPIITGLANKPQNSCDDSIRLTIPRACRFVYDIASNRGGRHDPEEINANEMDANASVSTCSWILAEMIRLSQKGVVDLEEARKLVDSLTRKKYPFIEEVDGRVYFHLEKKTAPDVALLALDHAYPGRLSKQNLIDAIKRNGFSSDNARKAVQSISHFVDNDGNDRLRLLAPGLRRAEEIIKTKAV